MGLFNNLELSAFNNLACTVAKLEDINTTEKIIEIDNSACREIIILKYFLTYKVEYF